MKRRPFDGKLETPFVICPRCHADVLLIPDICTAYQDNKVVEKYAIFSCPECGMELRRQNIPLTFGRGNDKPMRSLEVMLNAELR